MNVLNRELLLQAGIRHTDAKASLDAWLAEAMQANWTVPMAH